MEEEVQQSGNTVWWINGVNRKHTPNVLKESKNVAKESARERESKRESEKKRVE